MVVFRSDYGQLSIADDFRLRMFWTHWHSCPGMPCVVSGGHAVKNIGGQQVSVLRTIHMGQYWSDAAGCADFHMPPQALSRPEPMSDRLHAILFNPYFVVLDPESRLQLHLSTLSPYINH